MSEQKWRPGEEAPEEADYEAYDENGQCGGSFHLAKGDKFPPTQNSGSYYTKAK